MKGLVVSPAPFQFSCFSGNCTWPDFSALGICAGCSDVTEATKTSHEVKASFDRSENATSLHGGPDDCLDIFYKTPAGIEVRTSRGCSFKKLEFQISGIVARPVSSIITLAPIEQREPYFKSAGYPEPTKTFRTYQTLPTSIASNATCSNFSNDVSNSTIAVIAISKANVAGHELSGRIVEPANITECRLYWCEKVFQNVHVVRGHR